MALERTASRALSPGYRARFLDVAGAVAAIRRLEFYVVELTIFTIPLLVVATSAQELTSPTVIEGLVMYFVLYAVGDMINCLADRDLDATYKTRLSRAVYRIGVRRVSALIVACCVVGVALAIHLALETGRWPIVGLVLVGVFLGVEYSIGPLHLKGSGLGHLICLWLLLYFLPMLCASLLIADAIGGTVVILAAAYATVEMGIILVNTSEDFLEDRAAGIRTTTVALGLTRTLRLATAMVGAGGIAFIATWAVLDAQHDVQPVGWLAVALLSLVWVAVMARMVVLTRTVRHAEDESFAVSVVKAHGSLVPIAATLVGWAGVICGVVVLGSRAT